MKTNYLKILAYTAFFSGSIYAQKTNIYKEDGLIQKTLDLSIPTSKEDAIIQFEKIYNLDKDNTFVSRKENSDFSGMLHQRNQQFYKGIKVEFGTLITHSREG